MRVGHAIWNHFAAVDLGLVPLRQDHRSIHRWTDETKKDQ
jgi:hypothetical protein